MDQQDRPGADERVFANPYAFDVTRTPNRHIAFGLGPHYCIGAPLARIALRLFFEEAIGLVEEFSLAGPVDHLGSSFTAGITSLPITARLRPGAEVELKRALDTVPPAPNWPTATVGSPDLKENAT